MSVNFLTGGGAPEDGGPAEVALEGSNPRVEVILLVALHKVSTIKIRTNFSKSSAQRWTPSIKLVNPVSFVLSRLLTSNSWSLTPWLMDIIKSK